MPTPFVPQTVTITDYFTDGSGAPLDGRAEFRPSVVSKTTDGTITRNPVVAKITGGNLTVVLIAPDSTGVTPQNWTYEVTLILGPPGSSGSLGIDAWTHQVWNIRPVAANPAVVLRDLTPVDVVGDSQFEVKSVAGIFPGLDGNVALTADDLLAGGVGYATQAALNAVDARVDTLEVSPPAHAARHAPGGPDAIDASYIAVSRINANDGVAGLDSSGKLSTSAIPAIALSDYLGAVNSEAAMLALAGQRGDWATRTDQSLTYVLSGEPSSTLANWIPLPTPADAVTSVAGKTGVVSLVKGDVGLGNVDNTSDADKPVSTAQAAADALKIDLTQKGAASGVATLDGSTKVPIAQLPTGTTSSTVTIGNDARLSDARTPVAHAHPISDVTGLLTRLDDDTVGTTDLANLGDLACSIPRYAASSQDSLSNQFLTIVGAVSMRSSFVATKLRLHVRGAVGSPGIVTLALFKGTNRLSMAKVVADSVVTGSFGTTGPKEFSFGGVTVNRGDFVYLALLHTNAGTDPIVSTLPGPPSADLINPTAAQTLSGYKSGQTSIPATLDVSAAFTANGRVPWFALAA